jgi:acetoin utilization protein AcuB
MKISEIMTTRLVTVGLDDKLSKVKEIFDRAGFHHLLVLDGDQLVGILSDRDFLKTISPNVGTNANVLSMTATLSKRAHQLATHKPFTLGPNDHVDDAIALFNAHSISCIPIVDANMVPVGILSWRDIFKHWPRIVGK